MVEVGLKRLDFGKLGDAAEQAAQPWSPLVVNLHGVGVGIAQF
jgi:hypothetical protein